MSCPVGQVVTQPGIPESFLAAGCTGEVDSICQLTCADLQPVQLDLSLAARPDGPTTGDPADRVVVECACSQYNATDASDCVAARWVGGTCVTPVSQGNETCDPMTCTLSPGKVRYCIARSGCVSQSPASNLTHCVTENAMEDRQCDRDGQAVCRSGGCVNVCNESTFSEQRTNLTLYQDFVDISRCTSPSACQLLSACNDTLAPQLYLGSEAIVDIQYFCRLGDWQLFANGNVNPNITELRCAQRPLTSENGPSSGTPTTRRTSFFFGFIFIFAFVAYILSSRARARRARTRHRWTRTVPNAHAAAGAAPAPFDPERDTVVTIRRTPTAAGVKAGMQEAPIQGTPFGLADSIDTNNPPAFEESLRVPTDLPPPVYEDESVPKS
eukprot:166574_1